MRSHIGFRFLLVFVLCSCAQTASLPKKEPWRDVAGNTHTYQSIGYLAMEELNFDWRPSGWIIDFKPRIEYLLVGKTFYSQKRIAIYVRETTSPEYVANDIAHELLHAFDYLFMTPELRKEWLRKRKLPLNTRWDPPKEGCDDDFRFGREDFAESGSYTFQGPKFKFYSKLGPPPNKEQQALIRKWIAELPLKAGI